MLQTTIPFPQRKTRAAVQKAKLRKAQNAKDAAENSKTRTRNEFGAKGTQLLLSPRKRLGAENTCNVPCVTECSPSKQKKENVMIVRPVASPSTSPGELLTPCRRLQFDETGTLAGKDIGPPSKETIPETKTEHTEALLEMSPEPKALFVKLNRKKGGCYQEAKGALHTALPSLLLCREAEQNVVRSFLQHHVLSAKPGSLYVSGRPGTGKTACLRHILTSISEDLKKVHVIYLNCMELTTSQRIFSALLTQLSPKAARDTSVGKSDNRESAKQLEKILSRKGPVILLVLDEIDQLDSRGQEVLYTIFGWLSLPGSRLVLIGIANSLDLTDRILPRLQAHSACRPDLLHFPPYTHEQLVTILQSRLQSVAGQVIDAAALQFCARKIAATSGDVRKALDVCRRAVELVEIQVLREAVLKPSGEGKSAPPAVMPRKVTLQQVSAVVSTLYGERLGGGDTGVELPLQQTLLVCAVLLLARHGKSREVMLGKLHEGYVRLCQKHLAGRLDLAETLVLCGLLESRGILGMKRAKDARLTKLHLVIEENEVEHALQDKVLLSKILQGGIPE
uniref:Cell division control protein n=1 Tax=Eptatretus burgeri TaxID=7764 RepID=A0A8C4WTF1_EPTBU